METGRHGRHLGKGNTPAPVAAPVRSAPSSPSKPASARLGGAGCRFPLASTGPQPTGTVNGNAASFAALSKSYSEGARTPRPSPRS